MERKTHREDWYGDGEASAKERFPLPPDKVVPLSPRQAVKRSAVKRGAVSRSSPFSRASSRRRMRAISRGWARSCRSPLSPRHHNIGALDPRVHWLQG